MNIERFVEMGTKRRIHRLTRPGIHHATLYVLWRSRREWRAIEIFSGRRGERCRKTWVLRVTKPCPAGTIGGCLADCR